MMSLSMGLCDHPFSEGLCRNIRGFVTADCLERAEYFEIRQVVLIKSQSESEQEQKQDGDTDYTSHGLALNGHEISNAMQQSI